MIGISSLAGIQATWSGAQAAARTTWGGLPASSSSSRWPQVRDVFQFSAFVPPDPLVENAIAARTSATTGERKTLSLLEQYRKWLQGSVGTGADDGWMTLADAVRDRVDLGNFTLLDAARTSSREVGALLGGSGSGATGTGTMGDLLTANAAWSIRSDVYTSRARAAFTDVLG